MFTYQGHLITAHILNPCQSVWTLLILPLCLSTSWFFQNTIPKTYLYNFDPLKPHFYIVKLGFTGVYIIFLISAQKHKLWVLVRTASPTIYVLSRNMKNIRFFYLNNCHFLVVKFSIYLNRRVFVMDLSILASDSLFALYTCIYIYSFQKYSIMKSGQKKSQRNLY